MTRYYPAYLDLRGRQVVVVGGGGVAARKVEALLGAGARVRVVSPDVTAALEALAERGAVDIVRRRYQQGDLDGAHIAILATDDRELNRRAARHARTARVLVNTVDDVAFCDFIAPAVVEQGDLTVAVSTNGKSPAMARYLRGELARFLTPDYAALLDVLERVRRELRRRGVRVAPERWQEQIDDTLRAMVRGGELAAAEERVLNGLVHSVQAEPRPRGAQRNGEPVPSGGAP